MVRKSAPQPDPHELIPWHVAGTLDPDEASRFQEHVAACRACAEEEPLLRSMKEAIAAHGEAFFLPHPDPEQIVAEAMEGLPGPAGEVVRQHLLFCSSCALEVDLVRREESAPPAAIAHREPLWWASWRPRLPWVVAVASLLVATISVGRQAVRGPRSTSVLETRYVEGPQRSAALSLVEVPRTAGVFQIVLPVDLPADSFPLSLEILDGRGRSIYSRGDLRSIYRDSFLFVACDRRDFPDGEYVARVRAAARSGAPPVSPLEFRFRVVSKAE